MTISYHPHQAEPGDNQPGRSILCTACGTPTHGFGRRENLCHTCTARIEGQERRREDEIKSRGLYPATESRTPELAQEAQRKRHEAEMREADRKAGVMYRTKNGRKWP